MGQHNSFKKDIDMLSEAYHQMYGKGEVVEEGAVKGAAIGGLTGGVAGAVGGGPLAPITGPAGAILGALGGGAAGAAGDEEDKTGGKSDHDLLASVEKKHTAGKALLDKARSELHHNGSLSSHTRDSLARDEYASWADEDAEDTDEADKKTFEKEDATDDDEAEKEGFDPDAD